MAYNLRPGETVMNLCDNASSRGRRILTPTCISNRATEVLIIEYDEHGMDSDTLALCLGCAGRIKKDAENHGYTVHHLD